MKELFNELRQKAIDTGKPVIAFKQVPEAQLVMQHCFRWIPDTGMHGGAGTEARRLADEVAKEQDKP